MQTIDKNVRAMLVVDFGDRNSARWYPEQCNREIAGPNPPSRAVLKFDDVLLSCFLIRIQSIFA